MLMKLFIDVTRDRLGWWRASFAEAPHETYGGFSPRAALRSLFACNPHRFIDESRIIAMDPLSPTHLRFWVKTRIDQPSIVRSR
jgi:hypothetical protein